MPLVNSNQNNTITTNKNSATINPMPRTPQPSQLGLPAKQRNSTLQKPDINLSHILDQHHDKYEYNYSKQGNKEMMHIKFSKFKIILPGPCSVVHDP